MNHFTFEGIVATEIAGQAPRTMGPPEQKRERVPGRTASRRLVTELRALPDEAEILRSR